MFFSIESKSLSKFLALEEGDRHLVEDKFEDIKSTIFEPLAEGEPKDQIDKKIGTTHSW